MIMSELKRYYEKLEYVKTNNKGKHVDKLRCLICNKIYNNHNNACSHVGNCLKARLNIIS